MATDYTATAYGVGSSRKDGKSNTTTALKNEKSTMSKGQACMRFQVASENEIMGGEIWVNKDTTVAADDTFTITVTAG
jgi:hypothetical protein